MRALLRRAMEMITAMVPEERVVKVKASQEGGGARASVSLMERPKRCKRGMLLAKRKKLAPRRMRRNSLGILQIAAEALLSAKGFASEGAIMKEQPARWLGRERLMRNVMVA